MFLTEESFHETADGSGYWATVLSNDSVAFRVNGTQPPQGVTITSVTADGAKIGGKHNITATVSNNSPSVATKVSLDCNVSGPKQQSLVRKTVTIDPGATVTVTWTDSVSPSLKPGTYTATVTVVGTGQSKTLNPFSVTK